MNTRALLILTISLGAIAIGLSVLDRHHAQQLQDWNLPKDRKLVSEAVLKQTHAIGLHDGDQTATLQPDTSNKWSVVETGGMRVDADKFKTLVSFLTDGKLERFITEKPEKAAALGIGKQYLEFLDASGTSLGKLAIGDAAQVGGRFVQRQGESAIYRTDETFALQAEPYEWVDKKLFQSSLDRVQSVTLSNLPDGEPLVFAKRTETDEKNGFELKTPVEGFELVPSTLESNLRSLLNLRFTKVVPVSEVAEMGKLREYAVTYTLGFEKDQPENQVVFNVSRLPNPETDHDSETDKSASNPNLVMVWFEGTAQASMTHPIIPGKVYEIASYSFDNLVRSPLKTVDTKSLNEAVVDPQPTP